MIIFLKNNQSVERQLKRGRETREHNQKVLDTGIGQLKEERLTDFNEEVKIYLLFIIILIFF